MNNRGFTLIELIIALTIILIVSLGFFSWALTIINTNVAIGKINVANTIAFEVAERLQNLSDNALIQPKSGNAKYVGFDASTGQLKKCSGTSPSLAITTASAGLTEYTNPFGGNKLYLYDNNACSESNPSCFSGSTITSAANANIDHPNSATSPAAINPVRYIGGITYCVVWSVAYLPCATSSTDKRKIFITVYWIDPEPVDTNVAAVQTKITAGIYTVKSVSLVVDKVIGVES